MLLPETNRSAAQVHSRSELKPAAFAISKLGTQAMHAWIALCRTPWWIDWSTRPPSSHAASRKRKAAAEDDLMA
jgi:hypothetical protein